MRKKTAVKLFDGLQGIEIIIHIAISPSQNIYLDRLLQHIKRIMKYFIDIKIHILPGVLSTFSASFRTDFRTKARLAHAMTAAFRKLTLGS